MESDEDVLNRIRGLGTNEFVLRRLEKQIVRDGGVIPFVGAGLSMQEPSLMPGWRNFLEAQARMAGSLTDVVARLNNGDYEQAAQSIMDSWGPRRFHDAVEDVFGDDHLAGKSFVDSTAVSVCQIAFGPIVTTNFDHVLEHAANEAGRPIEPVFSGKLDIAVAAFHGQRPYLLKLHGDVSDRTERILTAEDYHTYYGASDPIDMTRPLPRVLDLAFMARPVLFIGCSLKVDRTLRILRRVADIHPEVVHYAIVPRPESDEEFLRRDKELATFSIRPLWYPANRHDLLRPLTAYFAALREQAEPPRRRSKLTARDQRIVAGLQESQREITQRSVRRVFDRPQRVVGRLALPIAHFRDRVTQRNELGRLLAEPSTRIVSVIGRGGMGKSALANSVLRDLEQNRWPDMAEHAPVDGIIYISALTAPITLERLFLDCSLMLGGRKAQLLNRTWASAPLSISEKIERLLNEMKQGVYVILLDNLEDLLNDGGQIQDEDLRTFFQHSLVGDHGVRLLVTARTPLAFSREVMPLDHRVQLDEGVPTADGVSILRELDPNNDCGLRDAPEGELIPAVEHLHGVPRALELLAGTLRENRFVTLDELMNRFYQQEDVVKALVREAYIRLDEDSRRTLQALAVFARPVKVVALEFLLRPFFPTLPVESTVQRLARANLVKVDRKTAVIELHPIDREYAYSELNEEGPFGRRELERQAADYYRQIGASREYWKTIEDLEPQLTEFEHRVRAGDYDDAAQLLHDLGVSGLAVKGYGRRVQAMQRLLKGKITRPEVEVWYALGVALTDWVLGPLDVAIRSSQRVLELSHSLGDRTAELLALEALGDISRRLGDLDAALEYAEAALATSDASDTPLGFRLNLALTLTYRGDLRRALSTAESLMRSAERYGDAKARAWAHDAFALVHLVEGRFDEAVEHSQAAALLYHDLDLPDPEAYVLNVAGLALFGLGQVDAGVEHLERVLSAARAGERSNPRLEGMSLFNLAYIHYARGELDRASSDANDAVYALEMLHAPEKVPAGYLRDALDSAVSGERSEEVRNLLACARSLDHLPDLHRPLTVLEGARRTATAASLLQFESESQALEQTLRDRLAP